MREKERDASDKADQAKKALRMAAADHGHTVQGGVQAEQGTCVVEDSVVQTLRRRKQLRKVLREVIDGMEFAREVVDSGLALRGETEGSEERQEDLRKQVDEVRLASSQMRGRWDAQEGGVASGTGSTEPAVRRDRAQIVKAEQGDIRALCAAGCAEELLRVVARLREEEDSLDFQAALLEAQTAAGRTSAYSKDNFAYGSTPYATWRAIMQLPAVAAALASCLVASKSEPRGRAFVVWGSSIGWLVFYASLTYGVRARL